MSIAKIILAILSVGAISLLYFFRNGIRVGLLKFRAKLKIQTLRVAIREADNDKRETGRKNIVVYNTVSGEFEPVQKRMLKGLANSSKNKNNAAMTEGRKRMMAKKVVKKRYLDPDKVKKVEEKSLYVTN